MSVVTTLKAGPLSAFDYRCTAGPQDRPFVERHSRYSVAYLRRGSFGYRSRGKAFELVAGSIMVGHPGDEYFCTHEHHGAGDDCLSFQLSPELADTLGDSPSLWRVGAVQPLPELVVLGELAQAVAGQRSNVGIDEAGLLFTKRFIDVVSGRRPSHSPMNPRDSRRAVETALWMDEHCSEQFDLDQLAAENRLSTFHFLRVFSKVLGVTPHQYLIRSRLRHAARLLADGNQPVTDVALAVGFADLSNFVRSFHRAAGVPPRDFRLAARKDRNFLQERIGLAV
jgi:AraC-like DNA-binding protein